MRRKAAAQSTILMMPVNPISCAALCIFSASALNFSTSVTTIPLISGKHGCSRRSQLAESGAFLFRRHSGFFIRASLLAIRCGPPVTRETCFGWPPGSDSKVRLPFRR